MCDHIGRYVNTFFVCHVMSLGLHVVRRPLYTGVVRRQQACVDRNAGANMWYVGWIMDYGDRKETFSYIFSYLCLDYYRDGGNFSYS